eukprot:6562659-Alexandrium_andersonii.AAC.1
MRRDRRTRSSERCRKVAGGVQREAKVEGRWSEPFLRKGPAQQTGRRMAERSVKVRPRRG